MKTIKKLIMFLVLLLFTFSATFAQNVATKELLCKKWIIDDESMKPIIIKMMKANPMVAGASEADLQMQIGMAMVQISGTKIEYKTDGSIAKFSKSGNTVGIWTLSTDGKTLKTKTNGKPERIFSFIEISNIKLNIIDAEGKNMILKPE